MEDYRSSTKEQPGDTGGSVSLERKLCHQSNNNTTSNTQQSETKKITFEGRNNEDKSSSAAVAVLVRNEVADQESERKSEDLGLKEEENGRERLKRHRIEMAGRVWIPDSWGQEDMLKDWIDCSAFDASLVNSKIMSARNALVGEGRRASSRGLRIEYRC